MRLRRAICSPSGCLTAATSPPQVEVDVGILFEFLSKAAHEQRLRPLQGGEAVTVR